MDRTAATDAGTADTHEDGELIEDQEAALSREAANKAVAGWPSVKDAAAILPAIFRPKIRLRLRGEWVQSGLAMYRYEFRVVARRHFFGRAEPVAVERLRLHWLFDSGGGTVKIGHRIVAGSMSVEKHWIFDHRLRRAQGWAEAWHDGKHFRSGLAVLE